MGDELARARRHEMVAAQIEARGLTAPRVLAALRAVPRHDFFPAHQRFRAYEDGPAPIGYGQTISQPYVVAKMSELLEIEPGDVVLEIGTGSGYQTAVLAELGADVYTIEVVPELAEAAMERLDRLDYRVRARCGDGYQGWPERAPFDGIIVTAAPPELPSALIRQLKVGGRMVVPVGDTHQTLQLLIRNSGEQIEISDVCEVRFVPMVHPSHR